MEAPQTQPGEAENWKGKNVFVCVFFFKREPKTIKISLKRSDKQFGSIFLLDVFVTPPPPPTPHPPPTPQPPLLKFHITGESPRKQFTGSQDVTELVLQKWMSCRGIKSYSWHVCHLLSLCAFTKRCFLPWQVFTSVENKTVFFFFRSAESEAGS